MLDILVGGFFGDEGKGKVASYLAMKDSPEMAIRTGSINAGHTAVFGGRTYKLRSVPSAFINPKTKLAIPPGALISISTLDKELAETGAGQRLMIDPHAGVITEKEQEEERTSAFLSSEVGSTKQGVGAAESKRVLRSLRLASGYKELSRFMADVPEETVKCLEAGGRVQVEGSQGHLLSLYHGEYPYVTSRNTTSSGILSEVGVGPKYVGDIIIIFKAFTTRVGAGPMEGEISPEQAKSLGYLEFGTVTGRQRRAAPFDPAMARQAIRINSATQVAITKIDVMFKDAHGVREYQRLPADARKWIEDIEGKIGVPISLIGTGEDAMDMVDRRRGDGK